MKYTFRRGLTTAKDLLEEIGRGDIPSQEVTITRAGDNIEIDLGKHKLTAADETKLEEVMRQSDMRRRQEPQRT